MSRSLPYNLDQIIPVLQMHFIPNPFERLCVKMDTSSLPQNALEESQLDYDFAFEQEVVVKSTEQLQSLVASEPPIDPNFTQNNGELLIPIEKLITTNVSPSTQEPVHNGIGSLLNIEGFDTQSTDPFQEAELKTINDMEELQTLIFPQANSGPAFACEDSSALLSATDDSALPLLSSDAGAGSEPLGSVDTLRTQINSMPLQQLTEESSHRYMNIDELSSRLEAPETNPEYNSPKPPVPAPRRLKGSGILPPSSPTPPPRATNPKNVPCTYAQVSPSLHDEAVQSEDELPPLRLTPPSHAQLHKQEPLALNATSNFYITNLTESMFRDIRHQMPVTSPMDAVPLYEPPQEPLSEEDKLYQHLVGMGFHLESIQSISSSFDTKNESQLIEYLLSTQNLAEANNWPLKVVETAFIFLKADTDQVKPYMQTFSKYKEMGFGDESIHSALAKCGKDYEKMLEILIGNA